jgi:hypothetical protein
MMIVESCGKEATVEASHGNLPHVGITGDQVTLTQIGIQAGFPWQRTIATCIVASRVFAWVRLKAVNETTQIRSAS